MQLQLLYSTGTVPGGSDVVEFTEVGIVDQLVLSDLQLLSGHEYYATVKGFLLVLFIFVVISLLPLF